MDAVKKSAPRALLPIYGLLLLLLIISSPLSNANTIIADRFTDKLSITSSLELAADANSTILITDIETPNSNIPFVSISEVGSNLGFTSTPYWIRFTYIKTKTPLPCYWSLLTPVSTVSNCTCPSPTAAFS